MSTRVNISVESSARFAKVVKDLRKEGLKVEQELEGLGVLSGSVDDDKVERLGRVRGVSAVERVRDVFTTEGGHPRG